MYGAKGNSNYKKQANQNLDRAVYSGQMTISDYYSKKIEVQQSVTTSVDDGHSCTKGENPLPWLRVLKPIHHRKTPAKTFIK